MTVNYVLVHGASHTGAEMEATAQSIRDAGHQAFCPTLAGNRPRDDRRTTTLEEVVQSLIDLIEDKDLTNIRLAGHS